MTSVSTRLALLCALWAVVGASAQLVRCPARLPREGYRRRCTYTCNRSTGQWIEGHCKAITGPKTSPPSVKKYHGLKRCQARRPGKKTAGCGYTCSRKSGRWVEKKCSSNSAWAWPTYFGFEEDLFCLNGKVIDAKLR